MTTLTRAAWEDTYQERIAIMIHDAGMTEGEAKERAWADMIAVFGGRPRG